MSTFKVRKIDARSGEVFLYDEIGASIWGGGISAKSVVDEVNALGKVDRLYLRINSPGGDVFDGLTIFNFLQRHPARIEVDIDGLAASIASLIAMSGSEIRMAQNAMMMIHDPWTVAVGSADEFRKKADLMDQVKSNLIGTYANRTALDAGRVAELMSAETWMTAEDAVTLGFADSATEELQIAARFDLSVFRNAPRRLTAKSQEPVGNSIYRAKIAAMRDRAKACGAIPQ